MSGLYYDADHLLMDERRRTWALEKAIESLDHLATDEQLLKRAEKFEKYLKGGSSDGIEKAVSEVIPKLRQALQKRTGGDG